MPGSRTELIMKKTFMNKFKNLIQILLVLAAVCLIAAYAVNTFVVDSTAEKIVSADALSNEDFDAAIILGCGVRVDGTPSHMLEDRLKTGIELYKKGIVPKLIMSGDHGRANYDEVNTMKNYAMENGVPSEDVFMDHAGFSTYDSMYRARDIFEVNNAVIVTQNFHLNRALYIASALGINAKGVSASLRQYRGERYVILREMLARDKDFVKCIIKPQPTVLGEAIPVSGSGDLTND